MVTVRAVIFDWGGTLTPWHSIDVGALWHEVCARHYAGDEAAAVAAAVHAAERDAWLAVEAEQRSTTLHAIFDRAGVAASEELLATYSTTWAPHTYTDPDAPALLRFLRERGIKVGVLSNTFWPRAWHEEIFRRDGVLDLIDGAVYTSELAWTKPHPAAFAAAMAAVGETDPAACVFVGDRPFDDVRGAQGAGMRAVLVPNSDVPAFPAVIPDAVIGRLADLAPLISDWAGPAGGTAASS